MGARKPGESGNAPVPANPQGRRSEKGPGQPGHGNLKNGSEPWQRTPAARPPVLPGTLPDYEG